MEASVVAGTGPCQAEASVLAGAGTGQAEASVLAGDGMGQVEASVLAGVGTGQVETSVLVGAGTGRDKLHPGELCGKILKIMQQKNVNYAPTFSKLCTYYACFMRKNLRKKMHS